MAGNEKNGLSEAVEKGANTANAIRGAVKTGKAVAAAAKGAAAGGPYGAIAGAVWGNRKLIVKIILAAAFIMMLPILFIMMLPALIFGGLDDAGDPEAPVLNDNQAIVRNIEEIRTSLNAIVMDGMGSVITRINQDFADSGGDVQEIINPYENGEAVDTLLIISQYCAWHNEDYTRISLEGLGQTVRDRADELFTYEKIIEEIERIEIDPDTGDEKTVTETVVRYTVVYRGDSYFADQIFFLTDEQKALAMDYSENLRLFLEDVT